VQSIDNGLEGAENVVYFTHDYFTMSSDKNSHLQAVAKLAKKHQIKNLVAVCPFEHDLAWSEDRASFHQKTTEAEDAAIQSNNKMTLLKTNLAFGPQTHLIHFLTQCAIIGKCPYPNLVAKESNFKYAPIHTDDIADAMGSALESSNFGRHTVNGAEQMTLREIMNVLEAQAGRDHGAVKGPMFPVFDYFWDFFTGTTSDVNMSRMHAFYEQNLHLSGEQHANPWHASHSVGFEQWVKQQKLVEENYSHPTMASYRCAHTD
jgi:uncharacterized protein YbjT (DUF2867 family)